MSEAKYVALPFALEEQMWYSECIRGLGEDVL